MAERLFDAIAVLPLEGEPDPASWVYECGRTAEEIMKAAWDGTDMMDEFPVYSDVKQGLYYATKGCTCLHYDV